MYLMCGNYSTTVNDNFVTKRRNTLCAYSKMYIMHYIVLFFSMFVNIVFFSPELFEDLEGR